MKHLLIILSLFLSLQSSSLKRVANVDAQNFSGLWYEIARTYNSYQKECVASTVEYILQEDFEYEVHNRCFKKVIGGELIEYDGSAESSLDNKNMAVMNMTYFWIFTKRYNVYYVDTKYQFAIVGDDAFKNLWIMSRTPKIDHQKLEELLALVEENVDLAQLIFTPQDEKGRYK